MGVLGGSKTSQGYSVIHDRLTIRGELDTDGTVRVEGRVEGPTHRAGTLIVGAGGYVVGDVEAKDVVVAGQIPGKLPASGGIRPRRDPGEPHGAPRGRDDPRTGFDRGDTARGHHGCDRVCPPPRDRQPCDPAGVSDRTRKGLTHGE